MRETWIFYTNYGINFKMEVVLDVWYLIFF